MSTYKHNMPKSFPCVAKVSAEDTRLCVRVLIEREDLPQGSSFSVTVDNWDGTWNLWLSKASADYLRKQLPNIINDDTMSFTDPAWQWREVKHS